MVRDLLLEISWCLATLAFFYYFLGWLLVFDLKLFGVQPVRSLNSLDYILLGMLVSIIARLKICELKISRSRKQAFYLV